MIKIDITDKVEFGDVDGESLPLIKCACGNIFTEWDFILGIYDDMPNECDKCGRKMIFKYKVTVYELIEG